ncbi:Short chain dehydrogenase andI [Hyphodiscus hymeniophilus]|uniref:Short chain dehydrogenase andI n=1 Tax=Hyphodiscus hymeniophilus TaxID=353542 RepID=A0A9P6VRI2_9HELO|nr:Short chain dehydrogenase andI [Hyphodiscus hymeniophilus]
MSTPTSQFHHSPTPITSPTQDHLSATGKIVLVTGGGTAIGTGIVEAFAKAKAKAVFLTGRRYNLLEDTKKKVHVSAVGLMSAKLNILRQFSLKYSETSFHAFRADISKDDDVRSLFQEINKTGSVDILVANAGYLPTPGPIATTETVEWWTGFEINVLGTYLLAKAFLNQPLAPTGTPVFIGVNTGVAHLGPLVGPMSGYGTSKLAAASVVEFLQAENPHLKAFNVSPGVVESDMSNKASNPNFPAVDSPDLMGHLAVWLASPESDFLKGRFIWANWDIGELIKAQDKIDAAPSLLRLTLEGWSDNFAALK